MHWLAAATLVTVSAAIADAQPMPPPPSEPPPAPQVAPGQLPPGAVPQADLPSGAVNTNVNLRRGPGTNYTVITLIPAGSPVAVGDCNGGWCQVTFQGQDGYVIATSLGQGGAPVPPASRAAAAGPPPGYPPDYPVPVYVAPPPYYGPYYYYGYRPYYYGYGPYGWRGGYWRRHW
jgi:hypothetical protein